MVPPTTERGADTRRRIVEAAATLLLERGYAATSLQDILSATGVTKGGFYFHFPSKVQLAIEVVDTIRDAHRDAILARAGRHERAVDQIASIVRAAAAEKRAQPAMAALGRLCQEVAGEPGAAAQLRPYEDWIQTIGALMRLAHSQGDMNPSIDIDTVAPLAVAAFIGLDELADLNRTDIDAAQAEAFVAFVFRGAGLAAPSPAEHTESHENEPSDAVSRGIGAEDVLGGNPQ